MSTALQECGPSAFGSSVGLGAVQQCNLAAFVGCREEAACFVTLLSLLGLLGSHV